MSNSFVVTEPSIAVVLLEDLKRHVRITHKNHDVELLRLVERATNWAQNYTRSKFLNTTMEWSIDQFADPIPFPWFPLQSVTEITYIDSLGATQTVPASTYEVKTHRLPGEIILAYDQEWPTDVRDHQDVITITAVVGYGADPSDVPEGIRQAVLMMAGYWFEHGVPYIAESGLSTAVAMPDSARSNLDQYSWVEAT